MNLDFMPHYSFTRESGQNLEVRMMHESSHFKYFERLYIVNKEFFMLIAGELNRPLVLRGQWKIKPYFFFSFHSLLIVVTNFIHCRLRWFQTPILNTRTVCMIQI